MGRDPQRCGPRASLVRVPSYGMRYLAKVLKVTLAEKFPDAGEAELYKASADPAPPHPTSTQDRDPVRGAPEGKRSPPCDSSWLTSGASAAGGDTRAGADGSRARVLVPAGARVCCVALSKWPARSGSFALP